MSFTHPITMGNIKTINLLREHLISPDSKQKQCHYMIAFYSPHQISFFICFMTSNSSAVASSCNTFNHGSLIDTIRFIDHLSQFECTVNNHMSPIKLYYARSLLGICHKIYLLKMGPSLSGTDSMMTSSNGNIFRVTGHLCRNSPVPNEFHAQRPVTRSFDVSFDLRQDKRLSKQWWGWWFETLSSSL